MNISEVRTKIDKTDEKLLEAFLERMELSEKIAEIKKETGLSVADRNREEEILNRIEALSGVELAPYSKELFEKLFELSKRYQRETVKKH